MKEAAFQEIPNLGNILQLNLIFHFQLVPNRLTRYFFQTLQMLVVMPGK